MQHQGSTVTVPSSTRFLKYHEQEEIVLKILAIILGQHFSNLEREQLRAWKSRIMVFTYLASDDGGVVVESIALYFSGSLRLYLWLG